MPLLPRFEMRNGQEEIGIRCGFRRLEYNGEAMKFTNYPEANEFLLRHYRKGYEL